jgi:hypothetical protein
VSGFFHLVQKLHPDWERLVRKMHLIEK